MNKYRIFLLPLLACISLVASCEQTEGDRGAAQPMQIAQAPAPSAGNVFTGKIIETMDAGEYTYVQLDTGNGTIWAAGPKTKIELGAVISIIGDVPMKNFRSESLNRDFETVYFVGSLDGAKPDDTALMNVAHSGMDIGMEPGSTTLEADLATVEGGLSITELLARPQQFSEQTVKVRGKVIKYTPMVMGRDWIHIRDSLEGPELTINTTDPVALGNTVVVEGILTLNKDYGSGYTYDVIIEDGKVTIE